MHDRPLRLPRVRTTFLAFPECFREAASGPEPGPWFPTRRRRSAHLHGPIAHPVPNTAGFLVWPVPARSGLPAPACRRPVPLSGRVLEPRPLRSLGHGGEEPFFGPATAQERPSNPPIRNSDGPSGHATAVTPAGPASYSPEIVESRRGGNSTKNQTSRPIVDGETRPRWQGEIGPPSK